MLKLRGIPIATTEKVSTCESFRVTHALVVDISTST